MKDEDGLYSVECRDCGARLAKVTVADLFFTGIELGWRDVDWEALCPLCFGRLYGEE